MINQAVSDLELWNKILDGDTKAFAALYDKYWLRIYKTANHYLKNDAICEEIVHDVFIIIWNKRNTLTINNLGSYLNAIARYEVYRHIKTVKLTKVAYDENYAAFSEDLVFNLGEERLQESDFAEEVEESLQKLPKRCRQIFYMSKIQHLTNYEIASALGISKHTVENQLAYALKHLRQTLTGGLSILTILVHIWRT